MEFAMSWSDDKTPPHRVGRRPRTSGGVLGPAAKGALTRACPRCGAAPGIRCKNLRMRPDNPDRKPRTTPHEERQHPS
jgi:predicted RNA-binding Zn-ribbon protein involved in translation (DUF1610 family)